MLMRDDQRRKEFSFVQSECVEEKVDKRNGSCDDRQMKTRTTWTSTAASAEAVGAARLHVSARCSAETPPKP